MATPVKADKGTSATPVVKTTPKFKKSLVAKSPAATDSKNLKDTVTTIVKSKREVKYIYPVEMADDALAKKKFRAQTRDKDKAFLKEISVAAKKKEDTSKLTKKYQTWRKTVFLVP